MVFTGVSLDGGLVEPVVFEPNLVQLVPQRSFLRRVWRQYGREHNENPEINRFPG